MPNIIADPPLAALVSRCFRRCYPLFPPLLFRCFQGHKSSNCNRLTLIYFFSLACAVARGNARILADQAVTGSLRLWAVGNGLGLRAPPLFDRGGRGGVAEAENGGGKQRGIDRAGLADRKGRHRHARRHLDDRQ
jgi:hypothetical protein